MIAKQILVGSGDQGDEAAKEGQRIEHKRGDAVGSGPGAAQVIADVAVGQEGETLEREGSAQAVPGQLLQPLSVLGGHGARGVKRKTLHTSAEGLGLGLDAERLEEGLGWKRRAKRLAHGISEEGLIIVEGRGGLLEAGQKFLRERDEARCDRRREFFYLPVGGRSKECEHESAFLSWNEEPVGK